MEEKAKVQDKKNEKENKRKKGSGIKRLLTGILLVFLLILAGGAGGFAYFRYLHNNGQYFIQEDPEPAYKYSLDNFIVNLAEQRRYLKIGIVLAFHEKELCEELEQRSPQIKDRVINILWGKGLEELHKDDALEKIKDNLILEINSLLRGGTIEEIYFTEFIIQ